jgi:starch synthase (maltosyl-transferring)
MPLARFADRAFVCRSVIRVTKAPVSNGVRIYNLFPSLVGSIDDWSNELARIAALGFDWVYVNPFHETGYSGSLYAVKDYYRFNPLFRGAASADDDTLLRGFVDAARARGIGVMMDLVVNHTARDSALTVDHPDWYRRDGNGEIESPSASDPAEPSNVTVWTDLAELDYDERPARGELVAYMAAVVRHYVALGIRGFRCDAAYKVPSDVWRELMQAARAVKPDTLFAAENLGAPDEAVEALRPAGFDYLFNSSKWWDFRAGWLLDQYEKYRHIAPSIAFPESHDTPRLASELGARDAAAIAAEYRFRYLFAATFSSGVMLPIGYEFGYGAALDVVMTKPHSREEPRFDISPYIARVNAMKAAVPALNVEGPQRMLAGTGDVVALVRTAEAGASFALVLINPDAERDAAMDADDLVREVGDGATDVTPDADPLVLEPGTRIVLRPHELRVFANVAQSPPPARRGDARVDARPVVIENVTPSIDNGRHAVKRIAGDRLTVEADIFREGHDAIAAVVKYRERGTDAWREAPMTHVDNDRWRGTFRLDRNTHYEYTVEAWPDAFATWHHDTQAKRDAGQPIGLELIEGRALVAAARERASSRERPRVDALLGELDGLRAENERADLLLAESTATLLGDLPDRSRSTTLARPLPAFADRRAAQVGAWYEFFPRSQGTTPGVSGTFADAARRLPDIRAMGFDVVYLPPIHPIGHAFRKGRNNSLDPAPSDPGSPWAIGNADGGHTAVEPALGTLADFDRFVAAAHANGIEVALDYALQCSPDHPYVRDHPEWFAFRPDGTIKYAENPPKKYQDIVNFNWFGPHASALWDELRDVVEFWIGHGVRIFRVDNPHTKPFAFWEWMIGDVQSRHPDVLFLAEAFTRPKVMKELAKIGFTQSYTYFTWRNFKGELTDYVRELAFSEMAEYYRPNFFANTPDILPPYLQTGGRPAFRIRLVLAATLSSVYGIYSGYELCENAALPGREEYADSEKYEIKVRDWDAPGNIKADVTAINRIRREHPALHDWRNVRFLQADHDNVIFYAKSSGDDTLLIAVNLDPFHAADVRLHLPLADLGIAEDASFAARELLGGERYMWNGAEQTLRLDPLTNPAAIVHIDNRLRVTYENPSY